MIPLTIPHYIALTAKSRISLTALFLSRHLRSVEFKLNFSRFPDTFFQIIEKWMMDDGWWSHHFLLFEEELID